MSQKEKQNTQKSSQMTSESIQQEIQYKFESLKEQIKREPLGKWNPEEFSWAKNVNLAIGDIFRHISKYSPTSDIDLSIRNSKEYPYNLELIIFTRELIRKTIGDIRVFTGNIDESVYADLSVYPILLESLAQNTSQRIQFILDTTKSVKKSEFFSNISSPAVLKEYGDIYKRIEFRYLNKRISPSCGLYIATFDDGFKAKTLNGNHVVGNFHAPDITQQIIPIFDKVFESEQLSLTKPSSALEYMLPRKDDDDINKLSHLVSITSQQLLQADNSLKFGS